MKKILAVIALILIIAFPLMAAEIVGETFLTEVGETAAEWGLQGLIAGTAVNPGAGSAIGAFFGAAAGAIWGGIKGVIKQTEEDDEKVASNNYNIDVLEVNNKGLQSQINDQEKTLARWQDDYDSLRQRDTLQAASELEALKENWGIYNSTLASQNRGGITARALSTKQKDLVSINFGDDMSLATDFDARLDELLSNKDYYNDDGELTDSGIEAYNKLTEGYGLYEKSIMDNALTSRLNYESGKTTLSLNKDALNLNKKTIQGYKDENFKIQNRRWGGNN